MADLAVLVSWEILNGSQDFLHTFSMALCHKWDIKNGFVYVCAPICLTYFWWSRWCVEYASSVFNCLLWIFMSCCCFILLRKARLTDWMNLELGHRQTYKMVIPFVYLLGNVRNWFWWFDILFLFPILFLLSPQKNKRQRKKNLRPFLSTIH